MFAHQIYTNVAVYLCRPIFAAVLFLLPTIALSAPQFVECNNIIDAANKTGDIPTVTSDPDWAIVRMSTSELYCREPIEVWKKRGLLWPVKIMPGSEAPKLFHALPKVPAPIKKVEKPAPAAIEAAPVAPVAPVASVAPVEPKPIPPVASVAPVEPKPIPPQHVPTTDKAVISPNAVFDPYSPEVNQSSDILEGVAIPKIIAPEEGVTKAPTLADSVKSRMKLGGDTTKDENTNIDGAKQGSSFYIWIWPVVIGLLGGGGAFLFLYLRASGKKDKAKKKNENDESDESDEDDNDGKADR